MLNILICILSIKYEYKLGLTENQHDGPEERKGEERLSVADKRVVRVVLRVHLGCERHTGDDVHSEAAETPEREFEDRNVKSLAVCSQSICHV